MKLYKKNIYNSINYSLFLIFVIFYIQINLVNPVRLSKNDSSKLGLLESLMKKSQDLSNEIEKIKQQEFPNLKIENKATNIVNNKAAVPLTPCLTKEGMLKIRDKDVLEREVPVSYAILNNERLTYYINPKDETSIQGSIKLKQIKGDILQIDNFPTCFSIQTIDDSSECSICAENEEKAKEWIKAITQNSVNCF